jgi:hypothetical protein
MMCAAMENTTITKYHFRHRISVPRRLGPGWDFCEGKLSTGVSYHHVDA